ncbi:uncharacterized protein LOC132294818 [Cornus florida]|uniref:uncharacterized protein LOC132294818 n=1 Tax=Cornus florida TaxID=4283 RepID=UPI00289EB0AC|nr:uncharacterized protein LOC132294818 [Cornus florida]
MGTTVHCKSYLPGYYSMKDLNEDSNSSGWPLFYGDKTSTNGQYYNDFLLQTVTDAFPGYDKDALKQIMLEHEAVFKNQVFELHRLYRIQRDMMDEVKKSVLHQQRIPIDTSSSSIPSTSQLPSEDARKWQIPIFPLANSVSTKPSISGAEIVNSPLSCTKVNKTTTGPSPLQNGCSSKDYEMLELRPSKVRKKLFDLQLPADEYIDTEEGEPSHDNKMPSIPSYLPNGNHKVAPESGVKLFLGVGGVKIDRQEDASRSGSCLRSSIGLADLNAPIHVEEETAPASVDFLGRAPCHGEFRGPDLSVKSESQFLGLPKKMLQNSQHGSSNGSLNNICVENKRNGRDCLSYMFEAGHSKSNLNSFSQGLQPDKLPLPCQPRYIMPNNAHQSRVLPTNHNNGDLRREGTFFGLEISERSRDTPNFNHMEPVVASHMPSPYQFVNSSDLANAWSQSVPSWGKPSGSLTQKLTSVQTHPCLSSSVTLRGTPPSDRHEFFGNKWLLDSSSRSNHGFRSNTPNQGEIYYGSSSVSKEVPAHIPSVNFDYLNCNKDDNIASGRSINGGSGNYFKGSNVVDLTSANDMNLNMVFSKSSSNEVVPQQSLEIIDGERNHWDRPAALPWLRAKPAGKNEVTNARRDSNSVEPSFFQASNHLSNKSETDKCLNQNSTRNITSASSVSDVGAKKSKISDFMGSRKILGIPIFENPCNSKNELSSPVSTSASLRCHPQGQDIKHGEKKVVIDINVACDPVVPESDKHIAAEVLVEERKIDIEVASCRNHIDLNLSVSEDEVLLAHPVASTSANVKIAIGIDLEAPVVPEIEEDLPEEERKQQHETPLQASHDKAEEIQDEVVRIAAEAIVAISSSGHHDHMEDATCHPSEAACLTDSLLWFVEVISTCGDDLESKLGTESRGKDGGDNEESSPREIDYFEAMTLNLIEIKEEEYMPKPLVPDNMEVEETGAISVNRSQKGPGRRGRQRRDFRKDILPGLASLSRHEVTEDLQTFGGLMRATGHPWNLGLTRRSSSRNGGARGRRRSLAEPDLAPAVAGNTICTLLMQQLNNIEVRPEDTSLTGWGKTTRRPRRQRCPAGNPPSVPLT